MQMKINMYIIAVFGHPGLCHDLGRVGTKYFQIYEVPARRYNDILLDDPEVTANIYCKSCNLPNEETQDYSTDLR